MTAPLGSTDNRDSVVIPRWQRNQWGFRLGGILSAILLVIWLANIFQSFRLGLNNLYYLPKPTSDRIVLVAIDNDSLNTYGRSPVEWDRQLHADLLTKLNEAGARVVAFDILFAESTPQDAAFAETIQSVRFSEGETRTRTLLPIIGIQIVPNSPAGYLQFQNTLTTTPELANAADNMVFVNTIQDVDNVVRRQPSLVDMKGQTYVSFSLGVLMAYSGIPPAAFSQLLVLSDNQLSITPDLTPDRVLNVDQYGFWQQNYFGAAPRSFPVVSFQSVISGEADPALFKEKIVLVGLMNATGVTDQYNVPLGLDAQRMAGVEIHANAIETLLQNMSLRPLPRPLYAVILVLLTFLASFTYIHSRWYWMIAITVGFILVFFVGSFYLFDSQQIVVDLFDGVLALTLPALGALGLNITAERQERTHAEFLLKSVVTITTQELSLEKMLPVLAEDIQQTAKTKSGIIWVTPQGGTNWQEAYKWGQTESPLLAEAALNQPWQKTAAVNVDRMVAIPFRWQGQLLGGMSLELEHRPSGQAVQILQTLADQIAPIFANAHLFNQVQEQNRLLQAWFDVSPNGIFVVDKTFNLVSASPRFSEHLNHLVIEAHLGKSIFEILAATGVPQETLNSLKENFHSGQTFRQEIRWQKQSFYFYSVPFDATGQWLGILNDISALSELSDLKTQMIRMASHDLKNPLGVVMGYVEMLQESTTLNEDDQYMLGSIKQSTQHMRQIIDDILNLEQLKSGRVHKQTLDFSDVVKEAIQHHTSTLATKKQTLTEAITGDNVLIWGDHRLLTQAVTNLVGNASKYTPDGGKVTVRLYAVNNQRVRLEVEDTGYGIPLTAQDKIFSQFYRARTSATAHIRGTGLGLSLVKSIIDDHHGQVGFTSVENQGSTFFIELPMDDQSHATTEFEPAVVAAAAANPHP